MCYRWLGPEHSDESQSDCEVVLVGAQVTGCQTIISEHHKSLTRAGRWP